MGAVKESKEHDSKLHIVFEGEHNGVVILAIVREDFQPDPPAGCLRLHSPPKMKLGANNRFLLYRNYIFAIGPRLLFAVFYGLDLFRLFGQKLKEKQVIWLE